MPNGTDPPESSTGDGQAEPIPTQGPQAPYETVFGRLAHIVMQQPRRAWAAVLLMTLASLLLATRITVDPNLLRLLPPDDPTTRALQELDQQEGGANLLTIAVEGKDGDTLDAYMSELQESLQELPEVEYAIYDLEPELAWRIGLMQLSPEDLSQIRQSLSGAISMGSAVTNPFVASRILDLGPLTSKLRMAGQHDALASSEGTARVLVRPTGSAHDPEFARRFMDTVYDLLASLDAPSRGLRVAWVGGAYRHSVEDLEGMLYDLRWTVVVSLTLVFLFVGFAFRDPRAVLLIFTPLLFGNLWTLGYAALSVGTLTTFTSFFSAVLIGLGVDFSIHLHARYREERAQGDSLRAAVIRAWDRVGPPCATAAIT
ncbi:MAG: MMPL family transporter, partial [Myxococcota bacterium]|nr:MMPL family transporter [Myxococcota bacterium]